MQTIPHPPSTKYTFNRAPHWPAQIANPEYIATVPDLVVQAARFSPEAIAILDGANTLTFGELVARSQRLAGCLIVLGAGPDVPVALCLERSIDFIVSALAVLMSGSAYLPLDPSWPTARLHTILGDAQAPLVISRGALAGLTLGNGTTIDLDVVETAIERFAPLGDSVLINPDQLAYIIYTSGSTGQPKGVEVTHGNLLNLASWHRNTFDVTAEDRASHLAGLGFDAAVWEIWPNLISGATVVLVDEKAQTSADLLSEWLVKEGITIAFVPTVLAEPMLTRDWPSQTPLRYLLTGGEVLHRYPSDGLPFTVVNNYGPTECTVVATFEMLGASASTEGLPSIGKPISNMRVHILDETGHPVEPGRIGEIFIGGSGVARGYRNNPEATAERFLPDYFSEIPGSHIYRTGDLGCFLPDGRIVFHGRVDRQVQIHGHRVETDEVVYALDRHPGVTASAVVVSGHACTKKLVAYVVPHDNAALSASSLREFLATTLPHYMVPSAFIRIPSLPLNSSGKLDCDALPDPSSGNRIKDADFRAPSTPTEHQLLEIMTKLLRVDGVGVDDNFFLLGFHSLLATQVTARVHERFGIQLGLRDLFEAKTVARLAEEVDRQLMQKINSMSDEDVSRYLGGS